jgi:hypothetical protein
MSRTIRIIALGLTALLLLALPSASLAKKGKRHGGSTLSKKADRNRDGLPDRWERRHGLSLRIKQARRDTDRDGLNNRGEWRAGSDPRDRDSDDDGVKDGDEGAGTVVSFEDGVLVIKAFTGETFSGRVTSETEVGCDDDHPYVWSGGTMMARASHDGEDDDAREEESGDDKGGERPAGASDDEPGDDDGGERPDGSKDDDDDEHGDDHGNCDPQHPVCGVADLKPGAVVAEARLSVRSGGAVWSEVELDKPAPAPAPVG